MNKKWILGIMLFLMAFTSIGCPFVVSEEHSEKHAKVTSKYFTDIHRFFDRHLWNYDWDEYLKNI